MSKLQTKLNNKVIKPEPPDPALAALGNRVRRARQQLNITQMQVAKEMGVTRSFMSQVESGKSGIILAKLRHLSSILKVPFDSLASGSGVFPTKNEPEAVLVGDKDTKKFLKIALDGNKRAEVWRLTSDVLSAAHRQVGDYLVIDRDAVPKAGDIVLAMSYGSPVLRAYLPPRLYKAVTGPQSAPQLVDGIQVVIKGVLLERNGI